MRDETAGTEVSRSAWTWSVIGLAALSGVLLAIPVVAERLRSRKYREQEAWMDDYIQDNLARSGD